MLLVGEGLVLGLELLEGALVLVDEFIPPHLLLADLLLQLVHLHPRGFTHHQHVLVLLVES